MKRFIIALVALSLLLTGATLAVAKDAPQALKGVDLKAAKQVTDQEAKEVRGTADLLQTQLQTCIQDRDQIRIPGLGDNCKLKCQ